MKNHTTVFTAVDLLPTLCAAAGVKLSADYAGDGESLIESFNGKPVRRTKPLFWKYYHVAETDDTWPAWAMREGDWKLLIDQSGQRVALYDLTKDRAEQADVCAAKPDIVGRMKPQLVNWTKTLPTSSDPSCTHKASAE